MAGENIELAESWNKLVGRLVEAREIWYNEIKGVSRKEIAFVPRSLGMKVLASSRTSSFSTLLSKLVDYWRGSGGLQAMSVVLPEETEEEVIEEVIEEVVEEVEDDHEAHVEAHIEMKKAIALED